jgi:hypothetical protein
MAKRAGEHRLRALNLKMSGNTSNRGRPESALRAACRELGIAKSTAHAAAERVRGLLERNSHPVALPSWMKPDNRMFQRSGLS